MKLKKVMLYTAPVALAGFLYLGGATGVGEVLAKTITTLTKVSYDYSEKGFDWWIKNRESVICFTEGKHCESLGPFEEDGYAYYCETDNRFIGGGVEYNKIAIEMTETQIEVPDDVVISEKTVPDKDPEAEAKEKEKERYRKEEERYRKEAERLKEEALQKQREEEALAVQKAAEKLNTDFTEQINSAIEQAVNSAATGTGAVAVIKTDYFTCFTQGMLDVLAAHPEVSYEIHYLYQGKHYVLTIPAGADLSSLENSDGYYGFRYLDSVFGGYEEME